MAVADAAALLCGPGQDGQDGQDALGGVEVAPPATANRGVLGPGHTSVEVVLLDGTGTRAGSNKNGVGVNVALGLTGRSGPVGRNPINAVVLWEAEARAMHNSQIVGDYEMSLLARASTADSEERLALAEEAGFRHIVGLQACRVRASPTGTGQGGGTPPVVRRPLRLVEI